MRRRKTLIKILLWTIGILAIFIVAGNIILKSVVEKKIRISLQQFQPYVQAGFSKAHVNLFAGAVQLDSLYVMYDPELRQQHVHTLNFSLASISGIHFFKLVTSKDFAAGALQLKNANITIDRYLLNKKDSLPTDMLKHIDIPFHKIFLSSIELNDVTVFQKHNNKTTKICDGDISLKDVQLPRIDTSFSKDSIHFKNLNCDLNKVHYQYAKYYAVQFRKFHISSSDSIVQIDSLKIVPLVNKYELGEKLGVQADHINASVNTIKVSGLDLHQFMQKKFIAQQITITKPVVYIFRDRRLARSKKNQPMPLEYLKQVPFDLNVQQFNLNDATVTSEEMPKDGNKTGYIKLEHVYIAMKPLLNHAGKTISSITSNVKASIMNAGTIHATINLSLLNGNSYIKGAIDELHLPAMNPSAENLGKFHIESGVLNKLNFEFTATDKKATGQIVGVYHDLVIDRLKLTKGELKKAKLPSFFLHKIIIPKNKDASLDVKHRTGKIDYDRDPTRFVTFYYLKALLDGIRDSFALGFVLPK